MGSVLREYHRSNPHRSCNYNQRISSTRPQLSRDTCPHHWSNPVSKTRDQNLTVDLADTTFIPTQTPPADRRNSVAGGSEKKMREAPADPKNIDLPSRSVKVFKIPRELPRQPTSCRSKACADSGGRTQRCRHWAVPRARRCLSCFQMSGPLHVAQPRVCRRGWSGARFRCW